MRASPIGANMNANRIFDQAEHWGKTALNFALPPRCVLCGSMDVVSVNFCLSCWGALQMLDGNGCVSCGRPVEQNAAFGNGDRCHACQTHPPIHDGIAAATAYDDKSGAMAMRLKYSKKIGLAQPMAQQMARHLPDDAAEWMLVPVPLQGEAGQPTGRVTISGGVACFPDDADDSVELLRNADAALYEAKNAGRNRVFRAEPTGLNPVVGHRSRPGSPDTGSVGDDPDAADPYQRPDGEGGGRRS